MQLIRLLQCIQCGGGMYTFTGSSLPPPWPLSIVLLPLNGSSYNTISYLLPFSDWWSPSVGYAFTGGIMCATSYSILLSPRTTYNMFQVSTSMYTLHQTWLLYLCASKKLFPVDYGVERTREVASFTYFPIQKTCPH